MYFVTITQGQRNMAARAGNDGDAVAHALNGFKQHYGESLQHDAVIRVWDGSELAYTTTVSKYMTDTN